MDRSFQVWVVFRRPPRTRGGVLALPGPDTGCAPGRHGQASTRRETKRELRADVGSLLLLPEEILHREGRSAFQTGRADALRPGGFGLSIEPCGASGVAWFNGAGLSRDEAHRRLAHLGPADSSVGKIAKSGSRICAFGLGPGSEIIRTAELRDAGVRWNWSERVHRGRNLPRHRGLHLHHGHAVRLGAEHLVPNAECGFPNARVGRDGFSVHYGHACGTRARVRESGWRTYLCKMAGGRARRAQLCFGRTQSFDGFPCERLGSRNT